MLEESFPAAARGASPWVRLCLAALAGLLLAACESGGGSSSETESTLTGQVFYPGDIPVESARILLLPAGHLEAAPAGGKVSADSRTGSALRETLTDAEGRFYFTGVAPGYYSLDIRKQDSEELLGSHTKVEVGTRPAFIQLPPLSIKAGLSGHGLLSAPAGKSPKARLFLYGQDWTDTSDAQGRFLLPSLPAGLHLLRIVPFDPSLGSLETAFRPDQDLDLGTLALGPEKILRVADFEHGETATPFAVVHPKGKWFTLDARSPNGAPLTFTPSAIRADFAAAYADSGAWSGKSLHVGINLGGNPAPAYALLGFTVGSDLPGLDFSRLDSLVFQVKGTGLMRVEFQTGLVLSKYRDWRHFHKEFVLGPEWTRLAVPVSDLVLRPDAPALKDGVTWAQASRKVVNIVFIADDPADFWLDDLYFYGLSVLDLAP